MVGLGRAGVAGIAALAIPHSAAAQGLGLVLNSGDTATVIGSGGGTIDSGSSYTDIVIGLSTGTSTLSLSDGGTLQGTRSLAIGNETAATGILSITGSGSAFVVRQAANVLRIGNRGTGTVTVSNGGRLANTSDSTNASFLPAPDGSEYAGFEIGRDGGTGTVTVTGADSLFDTYNRLIVGTGANGTGTITLQNGGTVRANATILLGYGNATASGTLNVGAAEGDAAAAAGTIDAPGIETRAGTGRLVFNHTGTGLQFSVAVSGGTEIRAVGGTTILTAANSHTGGTFVGAGATLQVGAGGTVGTLPGNVTVNGALTFNRSDALTVSGTIGGSGTLTQAGSGTLTLSGTVNHSGGTTVQAGTLSVASTGSLGGTTTVSGGRLAVAGQAGTILLGADGTLSGTGTVGAVTASGRVAPGNSIGTLSTGSLTFNNGSVYAVDIAANDTADKLDVTGTVTINAGAVVEVTPQSGTYRDGQQFTIIATTGGITGSFDEARYASGARLALFDLRLLTVGNDLLLELQRNAQSVADSVTDPALGDTAAGLDELEGVAGQNSPLLQAIYGIGSGAPMNDAVRQTQGLGVQGASQTARIGSQSALAGLRHVGPGRANGEEQTAALPLQFAMAGALGMAAESRHAGAASRPGQLWLQGLGGIGERAADGATPGDRHRYAGLAGGVWHWLSDSAIVGLSLAQIGGRTTGNEGRTTVDNRTLQAVLHGAWFGDGPRLDWALGVARHQFDSRRRVRINGFDEVASGRHAAYELLAGLGARWNWALEGFDIGASAHLGLSWYRPENWRETGAGDANLTFQGRHSLTVTPTLGLDIARSLALGDGLVLTPSVQLAWSGQIGGSQSTYRAGFVGTTARWTVPAAAEPRHAALIGLGATLASGEGWTLEAAYAGRLAAGGQDHGLLLGGSVRF